MNRSRNAHGSHATSSRVAFVSALLLPFFFGGCANLLDPFAGLPVAMPQFTPASGTYSSDLTVTITEATAGATVYYTTDGSTPTTSTIAYSAPIVIKGDGTTITVKAIAAKSNMTASAVVTATYTISHTVVAAPLFSPTSGTYSSDQLITITDSTPGSTIYYTTDGTTPTIASSVYSGTPLAVAGSGTTTTLKAYAAKSGMTDSQLVSAEYTINYNQVSTPQIAPTSGTYSSDQTVTIRDDTPGATIYYTTDGSTPASTSASYVAPFNIAGNGTSMTIKAYATKTGLTDSTVATDTVTITYPASPVASPAPLWAQVASGGSADSVFDGTALDAWGNLYAVGYITGTGTFSFGNGVTATGSSSGQNLVIVKYNASRTAQWASTVTSASGNSVFTGVTVDPSGNVCAVGYVSGTGSYTFGGSSVTATASSGSSGNNLVIAKYDPNGNPQWAQTVASGANDSAYNAVASDSFGDFFAAGYITSNGTYDLGNGVSVTSGSTSNGQEVLLVKYDSSGAAQWGSTQTAGYGASGFSAVAIDASGNLYAAGYLVANPYYNNLTWSFGGSTFLNDYLPFGKHDAVIVQYSPAGTAGWAQLVTANSAYDSSYAGVAVTSTGDVYAVGYLEGTTTYLFGNGVTKAGSSTGSNLVLTHYNPSGQAQWASTPTSGALDSALSSVSINASGGVVVVGYVSGTQRYTLGGGLSVVGSFSGHNSILADYDAQGNAQWAQSITDGTGTDSYFSSVSVDSSGNIYAVGRIYGAGSYGYGSGVTATGTTSGWTAVAVRY